ncbi:hypothetical protein [Streptomyces sp. NBC_00576]|uniref:hypothetical protein n=1 Tax=Streptomyces sp. NBC_00576 TaxID=2903665 RepID=UPI002E7FBC10|nr:hypothetical protein [Streptomyces sp. NBC_00576]WUB72480.1 hypothetical protein OG734_21505 [Streptomyces sp. NBC_00576]
MILFQVTWALCRFAMGAALQSRLGALGIVALSMFLIGIRVRHNGLAVGAAVVLVLMMTQA